VELGFLGGEALEEQITHAWALGECAEEFLTGPANFLDLGSGGGLPGLVLASRWQGWKGLLLDSNLRRTTFLTRAVEACGWTGRVGVLRSRAESAARTTLRGGFDLVVARSFASPPVTAECAAGFLRVGGILVVSEPPPDSSGPLPPDSERPDPVRWPTAGLEKLGLEPLALWRRSFGFQVLRQVVDCPDRFPRREGIPAKRPIYPVRASRVN